MATTQNTFTGNGVTTNYAFTFPYISRDDVYVSVDGTVKTVTTDYTFANATTISFNTAPANGTAIRIYRTTANDDPVATFYSGSAIRAGDLNDNILQILYATQELTNYSVQDAGNVTLNATYTFTVSPSGPTPTENSHFATKAYVDGIALSGSGITDGDKGDITLSSSGTVWTIDNNAVTTAKIQDGAVTAAKLADTYVTSATVAASYAPLTSPTLSGPTFTGAIYSNGSYRGNVTAVAALNIDCSLGNYFTKAISGNSTFTVSNVPSTRSYSFMLELTHTSGTVTWFSGVQWPGGVAPSLTTGKTHLFMFHTDDSGTTWRGASLLEYTS